MSKIILDVNKNPPIKTYNHHAFGTGIITSIDKGMNWIYNNYIQLSYYPEESPFTFEFYMDYIYNQPVFDREYYSDETMKMMKFNPVKFIVSALSQEKYVECCVDEYHISKRDAYMTYHFIHNILIYGFDDAKKEFYTMGYDENNKYTEHIIPYKQLLKATPSRIHLLKFRKNLDYDLAIGYIDRQIKQYNGDIELDPVGSYPKEGRVVGVEAVNALCDYICECVENEEAIDIRPIHILFEHRKLMLERLNLLASCDYISEKIVDEFSVQVQNCEKLRNRVLLYNVRQEEKDLKALLELQNLQRDVRLPELRINS